MSDLERIAKEVAAQQANTVLRKVKLASDARAEAEKPRLEQQNKARLEAEAKAAAAEKAIQEAETKAAVEKGIRIVLRNNTDSLF